MQQRLTCPRGHHWEASGPSSAFSAQCPICGALADTLLEIRGTDSSLIEFPPGGPESERPFPSTRELPADWHRPPPSRRAGVEVPGYEVLDELGRGGAGVVYKARQIALDRLVALKVLVSGPHAGPAELTRFRTEAESVARLHHPHIVQIHDVGFANDRPYFALEYLAGGSLAAKLAAQPQPPRWSAELVQTLARAVHFAHEHGILHRDLKPGNVLLDADGTPKIADFGLAKRLEIDSATALRAQLTPTGAILGTPSYMAPEQAGGATHQLGPAVDVYALGAILYEMLTGRPPFVGETLTDTLRQVIDAEPIAPRHLNPGVPRDLETICLRCLEKRPGSRYSSAAELADDLGRFLGGHPIHARPIGRLERALKWARRRPAQAALLAVTALALLLGAAGVVWHEVELRHKNDALTDALKGEEKQRQRNVQLLRITLEVESDYGAYLDDQLKPLPHLTPLRRQLLEKRLKFYKPILRHEPGDPEMRQTQGLAHLAVGIIQQRLGNTDEAEKSYETALERLDLPPDQATPFSRRGLADACVQCGTLLSSLDRDDEADRCLQRGEKLLEQLAADESAGNRDALALACHNRAAFLRKKGQIEPARLKYTRAIELRRQLVKEHPQEEQYQRGLAGSYINLGALYLGDNQPERAREELTRAEEILRKQPLDVDNRFQRGGIHYNLGVIEQARNPGRAVEEFQQALDLWSKLLAQFPDVANYRFQTGRAYFQLGMLHEAAGRLPHARQALRQYLTLSRELAQQAPDVLAYQKEVRDALYHLGRLLRAGKQNGEAEGLWQEQRALLEKVLKQHPEQAALHQNLSLVLGQLGDLYSERGPILHAAPPLPLVPVCAPLSVTLHNLANLSLGQAYLNQAAACYRQGLREQRQVLKLAHPQPGHYIGLTIHAESLALVAGQRGSYEDMADAAEAAAEAAQGLASAADGGQRYRKAAGYTAYCVILASSAANLPAQERAARARQHAERAVELLAKAVQAGFRNTADLEQARDLAPLRSRADFQKLLTELKKKR